MNKGVTLNSAEAAKLLNIGMSKFYSMVAQNIIRPLGEVAGRGKPKKFSKAHILQIQAWL